MNSTGGAPYHIGVRISVRIPRHARLIFFDETGYGLLRNYICETDSTLYLDPRKSLNIWVAIRMILSFKFSATAYYATFLRLVKPKFIVSLQDNNLLLHSSSIYSPTSLVVAVQNGLRGTFSHNGSTNFWNELNDISSRGGGADVIFTFDNNSANRYRQALKTKQPRILVTGSLRNNALDIARAPDHSNNQRLVYISSFPNLGRTGDRSRWETATVGFLQGVPLTFGEFYRIEGQVAKRTAILAEQWSLPFTVIGKRPIWQIGEYQYFKEHLEGLDWTYLPRETESSSYNSIYSNDLIVNIDSTLGYELFSRGLRVAFIAARMDSALHPELAEHRFGYPEVLDPTGPFWTDTSDENEFDRVVSFIRDASGDKWSTVSNPIRELLFEFDYKNTKICRELDAMGISTLGPRLWDQDLIPTE